MKEPRLDAFDPKARPPKLKSPLTNFPAIQKPTPPDRQPPPGPGGITRPSAAPKPPRRKIKKRHAFDVYEDQIERLRQFAADDIHRGGRGSMSKLVRDALDDYIRHKGGADK